MKKTVRAKKEIMRERVKNSIEDIIIDKEFSELNSTTLLGNLNNTDISFFIEKMQRFPKYFATKGMCSFE